MSAPAVAPVSNQNNFSGKEKPREVRKSNIQAAKAVADVIRTSLGPKGMDKMIQTGKGEVIITNDGHTILKHMAIMHPAAKMLVELSASQDIEAGDGTTSVAIICGALLGAAEKLLNKGIHPTSISEAFSRAARRAVQVLDAMSIKISLSDRNSLLNAANTSLNSKIVSQFSSLLAPMAVDAVMRVIDPQVAHNVNLNDIRIVKSLGGTIDDTELVDGLVLTEPVIKSAGGPTRIEKARIGLIQFQLSPPKPDLENQIVVNDYRQMDKILKEERVYLLNLTKKIKKAKCNVLLIQKSILRDAVNDLSLHFLAKLNIMVIKDIERDEIEFITKSTGCKPVADIESFSEDKLGSADLVEEVSLAGSRIVKVLGIKHTQSSKSSSQTQSSIAPSSASTNTTLNAPSGQPTAFPTPETLASINSDTSGLSSAVPSNGSTQEPSSDLSSAPTSASANNSTASSVSTATLSRPIPAPSQVATVPCTNATVSILVRGASQLVLDEAERSLHDALCVIRCLVKQRALIAGGGAPEIEMSRVLSMDSIELSGTEAVCWQEFAKALEVIPTTLAENAGLNAINVVTELRNKHAEGAVYSGVSVKKGVSNNIADEHVLQPLLVSSSAIQLATETVKGLLRIDDIALSR